jgi:hypothetical protein
MFPRRKEAEERDMSLDRVPRRKSIDRAKN